MNAHYEYRNRGADAFAPHLSDGMEPRYLDRSREGSGKGGVIAIVLLILGIAAGMYFVAPDDEAGVQNRSAVTEQQRPATGTGS